MMNRLVRRETVYNSFYHDIVHDLPSPSPMFYSVSEQSINSIAQALFNLNIGVKDHSAIINLLKENPIEEKSASPTDAEGAVQ